MRPSSPSKRALAAFLLALFISSPHDCTSFSSSRIPIEATRPIRGTAAPPSAQPTTTTCHHNIRPMRPLHSTLADLPMRPMEDEKEKNSKRNNNTAKDEDQKEWKQVVGGFVPKFLKRDGPTVQMVDNLDDYKKVVADESDRIVVVRFFAPWCKSCKAAHPHFKKMASEYSRYDVKFVEVPLTKETAYIHEGLGVPSVPFGHIYHPEAGLVEEKKINRKVFRDFREALDNYVRGSCPLPIEENDGQVDDEDDGFQ